MENWYQDPSVAEEFLVEEVASDLLTHWEWDFFHPADAAATAHFVANYRVYGMKCNGINFQNLARAYHSNLSRVKGILAEVLSWHGIVDIPSATIELLSAASKSLP